MTTITEDIPAEDYNPAMYELLKTVNDPAALRQLDRRQLQQLADELRASGCVVIIVPASEFVEHIKSKFIAQIQKFHVWWIMRHAHGIAVHVLDGLNVKPMHGLAQATTGIRPE